MRCVKCRDILTKEELQKDKSDKPWCEICWNNFRKDISNIEKLIDLVKKDPLKRI